MGTRETGTAPGESLLERDRELGSLDELLAGLADERAGFALIEGPAGIGKSRLLTEIGDKAAGEGFKVLSARGGEPTSAARRVSSRRRELPQVMTAATA